LSAALPFYYTIYFYICQKLEAGKFWKAGRSWKIKRRNPSWKAGPHYMFVSKLEQILLFGNFWKAGTFI
jgi:hypothetical protein